MRQQDLRTFHVMPLLAGHEKNLAADAEKLLNDGVCTDIACIMALVPEGNPPENKAKILGEIFSNFRRAFKGDISRIGILAQATIGHGWIPDEPSNFQKIIRHDGNPVYQMCPLDKDFQAYIRDTFRHLASLKPAFIMIDDDFRLLTTRNGCYCPLHIEEMGKRLGKSIDRDELLVSLRNNQTTAHEYDNLLLDSLMLLASQIREAIDESDSTLPGYFCACKDDIRHAEPLAKCLAGKGNRPVVRINNARYLKSEMRSFPHRMFQGAVQVAALDSNTTVLAETDTCPHNRYSTGAQLLHSHYTGSIIEGCQGAKHWITRIRLYEPASGEAYRKIMTKYHGFYETLFQVVQDSVPSEYITAVLPFSPPFNSAPDCVTHSSSAKTWANLLGVLGLPCNYAKMSNLPAMLTGEDVDLLSDDDIQNMLKNSLLLDGSAAEKLSKRGFASCLGVKAEPWIGPKVSGESWGELTLDPSLQYSLLTPTCSQTSVHSILFHRKSSVSKLSEELGPAVTLFENSVGTRFVVLAATFGSQDNLFSFGFYDERRKLELVDLLGWLCGKPIAFYYAGDAEVYLKLRRLPDKSYILAVFNLGYDYMTEIPIVSQCIVSRMQMIMPEGNWQDVEYFDGCIKTDLFPAEPKVFRITTSGALSC